MSVLAKIAQVTCIRHGWIQGPIYQDTISLLGPGLMSPHESRLKSREIFSSPIILNQWLWSGDVIC